MPLSVQKSRRLLISVRGLGGKESTGWLPFPLLLLNSWATLEGPCGGAERSGAEPSGAVLSQYTHSFPPNPRTLSNL